MNSDQITLYSIPLIGLLVLAEMGAGLMRGQCPYSPKETIANFYLMGLAVCLNVALRTFYVWIYGEVYTRHIVEIAQPIWYWVGLLIFQDGLYYVLHWVDHRCRLFWAVHVTHHSSTDFNLTVGFRSSVLEPVYRFVYFIPLAYLGFRPLDIMFIYSATQIWGVFVHTKAIGKLPSIIEYIFVTPSHHRVHHGSNSIYLDKNMGMFFIIWDRIFGTFQEELASDPVRYGLVKDPGGRGPFNIVFHEFKEILKEISKPADMPRRLKIMLSPPGRADPPVRRETRSRNGRP